MEELSSLGVNLLLIKLDGIRFLLSIVVIIACGILAYIIGVSVGCLVKLKKKK